MGLLDSAKALGEKALDKGKDAAEIGKAKIAIAENESAINKILAEVAKDLFENHLDIVSANYPEQLAKVNELKAAIEAQNAKIAEVKAN